LKTEMKPLVPLTLPYLAALTPEGWDVTLVDEQIQDVDFHSKPKPDVVAITTWTIHSIRAYDIADEFRRQGVPVIMGGPHVWFDPQEAARHCDAIGIGEGESIWARMLEDAVNGRLQKVYHARSEDTCLRQRSFRGIHRSQRMDALLRGFFASAGNPRRRRQIADQVPLRLQIILVELHSGLEFAMSFVRQRKSGKGSESACLLRLAAIRLPEPVVIIRAVGFERDGAFQAGNWL
jgi:radical SAM superfamily enzyme YgiQ (UPF0313 family)